MSSKDYYTRDRANEGATLHLETPEGENKGDWIKVAGIDSDHFRRAKADHNRRMVAIAGMGSEAKSEKEKAEAASAKRAAIEASCISLTAALILDWSFKDEEPTLAAVENLLTKAPQLVSAIDEFAGNRHRFFASASMSSSHMPEQTSSSTSLPQGQQQGSPSEQS
jgi:hypothetical protein